MRWLGCLALATAFVGAPAWADEPPTEPLALRYDAAASCPDASTFFTQLRARTARVRAPNQGETARVLVVRVAASERGFLGHLHFEDAGATTSPRVVEAGSCTEVIEALGLSAALAVDPSASTAPAASLSSAPEPPSAATSVSSGPSVPSAPSPAPPPPPRDERPAQRSPTPSKPLDARFAAGLAVEAASLKALVPSGRVFLEGELWEHASLFAPSLRVFAGRSLDVDRDATIGNATLAWSGGGLDACPIRVHLASNLALRPCAEVTAGVLAAHAERVDAPTDQTRAWAAVDVHGRLAWELFRFLSLEAEGGPMVPLTRDRFFFRPSGDASVNETTVYQAPIIGFFGRLGAVVHFP